MKNPLTRLLVMGLILLMMGCTNSAKKSNVTEHTSGFLQNYDLLKPVKSPEGIQIYTYKNPAAHRNDYHAAIVEPVFIYEDAIDENDVTQQRIENARHRINAGIQRIVREQFPITDIPGTGVFRLQVAITGASLESEGFKPWNVIPVSAAITLATNATGLENKRPVLVVELKITDSKTGKLLKETFTTISGEYFRQDSNTSDEFTNVADKWVQHALQYSNTHSSY